MPVRGRTDEPAASLLPIALTMGDPSGIGPDIALMSWRARAVRALHPFVVYGDASVLIERATKLGIDVPVRQVAAPAEAASVFPLALPVMAVEAKGDAERAQESAARLVIGSIEAATAAVAAGEALALVTNPIAKRLLGSIPLEYPGHTAYLGLLAERYGIGQVIRPVMMMVSEELKVVPATVHIPLAQVPHVLTKKLLIETVRTTAAALQRDFGIARPRIALTGLNPHAGEAGLIGNEEEKIVAPAIDELKKDGLAISGPHSADSMFHKTARSAYDAAVAMYHDQALIPFKTLSFERGVNVTLGLPFVRTSPDHGTAYALAGTGDARPDSLIAALELAAEIGARRAAQSVSAT